MNEPRLLNGYLKQQCLDSTGLYEWLRKRFQVDLQKGVLFEFVNDTDDMPSSSIALSGAKYAKEWSVSSAIAGFGFDIVWSSGKIWSFLADDEASCRLWVDCVNNSISYGLKALDLTISESVAKSSGELRSLLKLPPPPQPQVSCHVDGSAPQDFLESYGSANSINNDTSGTPQRSHSHLSFASPSERVLPPADHFVTAGQKSVDAQLMYDNGKLVKLSEHIALNDGDNYFDNSTNTNNETTAEFSSPVNLNSRMHAPVDVPQTVPRFYPTGPAGPMRTFDPSHPSLKDNYMLAQSRLGLSISDIAVASSFNGTSPEGSEETKTTLLSGGSAVSGLAGNGVTRASLQHTLALEAADGASQSGVSQSVPLRMIGEAVPSGESKEMQSSDMRLICDDGFGFGGKEGEDQSQHRAHYLSLDYVLELEALRLRCKQLSSTAEREAAEAEASRQRSSLLQRERDEALTALTKLQTSLKEKEREAIQSAQNELQARISRAANDSDSYHQAEMRATREQHQREMACLREELSAERKRSAEILSKETKLRDELEAREFSLRRDHTVVRDQNLRLSAEVTRLREAMKTDLASWEREKDTITATAEARVGALQEERDALIARAQADQRMKITELTKKFDLSLADMESELRETIRQEMAAEKMQELAILQKKCTKEVETARTEERRIATEAVEELKKLYGERESQTAQDLEQLEKLHAGRVTRLEQQVTALKSRAESAEDKMNSAVLELNKITDELNRVNERYLAELTEYSRRADTLTADLSLAHQEVQEARMREMSYREQLTRVLEEARVRHAELIELQKQATDRSAQATVWRKAASEIDLSQATIATQLQIAKEEIAMLEMELRRVKDENSLLRKNLGSADRLVYGVFGPNGLKAHSQSQLADDDQTNASQKISGRRGAGAPHQLTGQRSAGVRSTSTGRSGGNTTRSLVKHPPWRPGYCNCACKGSGCKCHGRGASPVKSRGTSPVKSFYHRYGLTAPSESPPVFPSQVTQDIPHPALAAIAAAQRAAATASNSLPPPPPTSSTETFNRRPDTAATFSTSTTATTSILKAPQQPSPYPSVRSSLPPSSSKR